MIGQGSPTLGCFFTWKFSCCTLKPRRPNTSGQRKRIQGGRILFLLRRCRRWRLKSKNRTGYDSCRLLEGWDMVKRSKGMLRWLNQICILNFKPLWMQISALRLSTWRMVARSAVGCLAISNQWSISKPAGFCNFHSSRYFHENGKVFPYHCNYLHTAATSPIILTWETYLHMVVG